MTRDELVEALMVERFSGPPWAPLPKPKRRQNPPPIWDAQAVENVPRDHPADCEARQAQLLDALDDVVDLTRRRSA